MFDEERLDEHGECKHEIDRLQKSEELAWVLIANAFGGDWRKASPEWKEAAQRWREKYHASIRPVSSSNSSINFDRSTLP